MITDLQSHMAAIAQLRNVLPFPEYPITPCWNTTLLTKTEVKITASRHSSSGVTTQGRILLSPRLSVFLTWPGASSLSKLYFPVSLTSYKKFDCLLLGISISCFTFYFFKVAIIYFVLLIQLTYKAILRDIFDHKNHEK